MFGTGLFSNVALLALPMAGRVVISVLAASIFVRAISSFVVTIIAQTEPMIHVITDSEDACRIIAEILP
jgi:hypothetical protein